MNLNALFTVTITISSTNVTRQGFGVPLILSARVSWPERTRSYADMTAVAVDFAATDPEYLAAQACFSQEPRPPRIRIGRLALRPTQVFTIGIAQVANTTVYKLEVNGVAVSVTSDASATNDEIVALLVTAINGAQATHTAAATGTAGSQVVTITANAPGNWLSLHTLDTAGNSSSAWLQLTQTHADPGVATDLAAIALEQPDFYQVVNLYNSKSMAIAIMAWVEANQRSAVIDTQDHAVETTVLAGATDVAATAKGSAYKRTLVIYHRNARQMSAAAWAGRCLPFDPGSETWDGKTLVGITAEQMTGTQEQNLTAKRANWYATAAGLSFTHCGTVPEDGGGGITPSGEYFDTIRGLDWFAVRVQEDFVVIKVSAKKTPYTDPGIAVYEAALRARGEEGERVGLFIPKSFKVTAPKAKDALAADRRVRLLKNLNFTANLQGAIHGAKVNGQAVT